MIKFIMPFLGLTLACCETMQTSKTFTVIIDKPNEEKLIEIKLKRIYAVQAMNVLVNTLNDTCMMGIMKVPPGKTGLLYKSEFFFDSLTYKYIPYKAVTGKLVFEHSFGDY